MPDFLKVTKPLVTQNQNIQPKPGVETNGSFNIQSSTKVVQTHNQSELLKQNNGLKDGSDVPTLLLSLLKDPTVTVSYLKNIFMLEELYKLLPANNRTVTKDIEDVLEALLIKPEQLTEEMRRQLRGSTAFSGELFDFLREISSQNKEKPDVQVAIARLLRSINSMGNQREILDSIANNLTYLQQQLSAGKALSAKLNNLIEGFLAQDAAQNFSALKSDALALIKNIEGSILFSASLSKTVSILIYNLSRYSANTDYAAESAYRLSQYLTSPQRSELKALMQAYIDAKAGDDGPAKAGASNENESRVMSSIIRLISQQRETGTNPADMLKLEKMLYSLLSSPCNFTPLLHFILPLQYNEMKAFAELWINPESDEKDMPDSASGGIHLLMVIDVDGVGRFEAEFSVYDSTIDFSLYCPKGCEQGYEELMKSFPKLLHGTPYHSGKTEVLTFESTRSLMDVFKSLPYRRVGVDVKI
ncbi:MAG: antitoxin [Oscillospiraceae bacterium]|nr:antitoxin [Oscillospiraceae bacterium]